MKSIITRPLVYPAGFSPCSHIHLHGFRFVRAKWYHLSKTLVCEWCNKTANVITFEHMLTIHRSKK